MPTPLRRMEANQTDLIGTDLPSGYSTSWPLSRAVAAGAGPKGERPASIGHAEKEHIGGCVSLAVPEQSARARKAAGTVWPPPSCLNQKRPSPRMQTGG